jgi:hypothetical protein
MPILAFMDGVQGLPSTPQPATKAATIKALKIRIGVYLQKTQDQLIANSALRKVGSWEF